jgi:alpha,alpha-trehalase
LRFCRIFYQTTGRSGGGGEYPSQDGFGWTNGVTAQLMALYPKVGSETNATDCQGL